mgnify:CR=1 FL=1
MKRVLPYRELSEREVPASLDARILNHAAARCMAARRKRRWVWIGSAAAALCIASFPGVFFQMQQQRSAEHSELLAMGDFSRLDQSGYNISLELNAGADLSMY